MSSTPTVAVDQERRLIEATVPYALMAVGLHILEQGLPLYLDFGTPACGGAGGDVVKVHLRERDVDAWAESIHVDWDGIEVRDSDRYPYERIVDGRLPSIGVRIRLQAFLDENPAGVDEHPHHLQVVES